MISSVGISTAGKATQRWRQCLLHVRQEGDEEALDVYYGLFSTRERGSDMSTAGRTLAGGGGSQGMKATIGGSPVEDKW